MTCPNATAPVDIVNNPDFICDLKCEYSFKYPQSSLNVTNRGEYLSLKTDQSNIPPVTYNANKYDIAEIRLYHPSLHSYSGKKADAEIILIHNGVSSNGNLLVCVPIVTGGGGSGDSAEIFDTIISEVAKTANSPGKKTTVNISTFSIDKFIPLKPYFSYSGTLPFSPCNGDYDYIVFSKNNGPLSMTQLALESLKKLTTANGYSTSKNDNGVFYNKKGPSNLIGKDDFYMMCDPTGSEGETMVQADKTTSEKFNTESVTKLLKNNIVVQILLGAAIIIALTKIGSFLLDKIKDSSSQAGGGGGAKLCKSIICKDIIGKTMRKR
jgi:carbonic anhydrase